MDDYIAFKDQVKKGFAKCKSDIDEIGELSNNVNSGFKSLKKENEELKSTVDTLKAEVFELKAELKGLNIALNYIKDLSSNQTLQSQTKDSKKSDPAIEDDYFEELEKRQKPKKVLKIEPVTDPYQALLSFKAKTNKREILKQKLLSMISETGIVLSELKFLFVDHYKYCSKATFYNYLKEVELEKIIKINRENSKNIVYILQPSSQFISSELNSQYN